MESSFSLALKKDDVKIERKLVDQLGAEALEALRPIAKKHGLDLEQWGGNFGDDSFLVKFEFRTKGTTRWGEIFTNKAAFYGMKPEWLGSIVMLQWYKDSLKKSALPRLSE